MTWTVIAHNPIVRGAVSGLATAAAVDFHVFRQWKSWHDAATYQWDTASLRWAQGLIYGAAMAAGWGAFIS